MEMWNRKILDMVSIGVVCAIEKWSSAWKAAYQSPNTAGDISA